VNPTRCTPGLLIVTVAVLLPSCSKTTPNAAESAATPTADSASTTAATTTTLACTKGELAAPATEAAHTLSRDNVYTVDDVQCADGWAVTSGLLANKAAPSTGAPTSFVFQQQGQHWVMQEKPKVCGTNPTTTAAPDDAKIPSALFVAGCAAG